MKWVKIAESSDLIVFENKTKTFKTKIEARKRNSGWEVFKTRINGDSSDLLAEHFLNNRKQALQLISKLKQSKSDKPIKRDFNIFLKREYKDDFIEKWNFTVNSDKSKNVIFAKYDTNIKVDLIVHEKYLLKENQITKQVSEKLGLSEFGESTKYDIFYYRDHTIKSEKSKKPGAVVNFVDIEFGFDDNEEYY
jgi:hypothetical protein